jgi:putative Mn2+ efflux pump MntP
MTPAALIKVAVVAMSLGLDVFAVCVGVGIRGVTTAVRWRIGIAFATAEMTMTLIGAGLGHIAGTLLGEAAGYVGFAALAGVGTYMIVESVRERDSGGLDFSKGWGLFIGAISISLDSLGIGFSILYIGVPLGVSLAFIGAAAAMSTTLGLTLGSVLGKRVEESAELWAGIILVLTGLVFAGMKYYGN